jgi:prepilin-type N-terminal cleavage/methylation domain-containing protein
LDAGELYGESGRRNEAAGVSSMNEASGQSIARRGGFTLIEALLAATILAVAAAAGALPFVAGTHQAQEAARLEQAVALGQAMMEEILARPCYEPGVRYPTLGPDAGETTRNLYDNIDDFHGLNESVTGLRNYNNQLITDEACAGLWRDVNVEYVSFANQQSNDTNSYVKVRVRVYDGPETLVTLYRLVARED